MTTPDVMVLRARGWSAKVEVIKRFEWDGNEGVTLRIISYIWVACFIPSDDLPGIGDAFTIYHVPGHRVTWSLHIF